MTELTDDEFYDNGNLANNIAALLGISPDKIRVMNVIREDSGSRRRRWAELGFVEYQVPGRFRRSNAGASLQIEIEPENSSNSAAKALDKAAESVVEKAADVAASVGEALGAEVNAAVAVAAPPKPAPEPEPPVTLAAQLGLPELMPDDDPLEFMKGIEKALGQDLDTLQTAEEKVRPYKITIFLFPSFLQAAEEQAIADAAAEPIIYKTPTRMAIRSQPTDPQILGEAFFQPFVIEMYDQDDLLMENVGVVTNPWRVLTFQSDCVETGPVGASVDGTTSVEFRPAVGTATFDNLIVHGDVTSCKFTFTISDPSDSSVAQVQSAAVTFLPPREEGGEI